MTKNVQRKLTCVSNIKTLFIFTFICSLLGFNAVAGEEQKSILATYQQARQLESSDPHAAFALYQDLVKQGDTESKVRLASLSLAGLGEGTQEQKIKYALTLLNEAAKKDNVNAFYGLAVVYLSGQDVTPDVELGVSWLIKAAEGGESRAQNQLGSFYQHGTFVTVNEAKAVYWYQKSAKQSDEFGLYNLALAYRDGLGDLPKNTDKAIQLFNEGVELNQSSAKLGLGNLYLSEQFGIKDEKKAFYWLNLAAQEGEYAAQTGLASCYRYGIGTEIDYEKAFYWYQSAVNISGTAMPRFKLAEMYMEGLGTEKNLTEAKLLFAQLSDEGYSEATTELNKINKVLSQSE